MSPARCRDPGCPRRPERARRSPRLDREAPRLRAHVVAPETRDEGALQRGHLVEQRSSGPRHHRPRVICRAPGRRGDGGGIIRARGSLWAASPIVSIANVLPAWKTVFRPPTRTSPTSPKTAADRSLRSSTSAVWLSTPRMNAPRAAPPPAFESGVHPCSRIACRGGRPRRCRSAARPRHKARSPGRAGPGRRASAPPRRPCTPRRRDRDHAERQGGALAIVRMPPPVSLAASASGIGPPAHWRRA